MDPRENTSELGALQGFPREGSMVPRFGALSSSVDPTQLSLAVTSGAKALSGLLVILGLLTATDANTIVTQIPTAVAAGYTAWQAVEAIWGVIRKIIVRFTANY